MAKGIEVRSAKLGPAELESIYREVFASSRGFFSKASPWGGMEWRQDGEVFNPNTQPRVLKKTAIVKSPSQLAGTRVSGMIIPAPQSTSGQNELLLSVDTTVGLVRGFSPALSHHFKEMARIVQRRDPGSVVSVG